MKPEVDFVLRSMMEKLLTEVAPAVGDGYVRSNVEAIAGLMVAAAEEYDRAAHVRAEENEAMRADLSRRAAPSVLDAGLRARLEAAAAERDTSLRVSDLNAANDRLRGAAHRAPRVGRDARRRLGPARQPCDLGRAPRIGESAVDLVLAVVSQDGFRLPATAKTP